MRKILLAAMLLSLAALPALAQPGFAGASGAPQTQARPGSAPAGPPPALPGLAARRAPEPIPADTSRVLEPTDALFDAITRGDLPAARDAVSRGADLDSRNVLGLTPVDAAVDRGRNEILFYLLSARSTARNPAPPPEANDTPQQRAARQRALTAERLAAERAATRASSAAPATVQRAAAPQSPRLFANDGGAPRPEVGFLGFDAGRGR
ncbi:ankyrin repeat domain-containing protein [Plastoroseomonas arctica]|uniref:Ankyrin repeat domain-containing protein n=1 Tax=Plastoroseomonas arctica TaxID=1509237 RepID=A0AAF1KP08_9PROT|nr:ankyrin repeat domain-containing protein [Plastoroseomonas arctica]MBR0656879.1 ankyrin repeat domain-containing protein [Plastoroseomonas arctica]